jgi:hypothetical protein
MGKLYLGKDLVCSDIELEYKAQYETLHSTTRVTKLKYRVSETYESIYSFKLDSKFVELYKNTFEELNSDWIDGYVYITNYDGFVRGKGKLLNVVDINGEKSSNFILYRSSP